MQQHAQRSAEKLRSQDRLARAVHVFLKTNRHRPVLPQYSPGAIVELPHPSDDSRDILHAAGRAFDAIYRPRYRFMKAGVMLVDLADANREQLSLLDTPQSRSKRERDEKLMTTLDDLHRKMGRGMVTFGRPSAGAAWHLGCANRTPRWEELPQLR